MREPRRLGYRRDVPRGYPRTFAILTFFIVLWLTVAIGVTAVQVVCALGAEPMGGAFCAEVNANFSGTRAFLPGMLSTVGLIFVVLVIRSRRGD